MCKNSHMNFWALKTTNSWKTSKMAICESRLFVLEILERKGKIQNCKTLSQNVTVILWQGLEVCCIDSILLIFLSEKYN